MKWLFGESKLIRIGPDFMEIDPENQNYLVMYLIQIGSNIMEVDPDSSRKLHLANLMSNDQEWTRDGMRSSSNAMINLNWSWFPQKMKVAII